MSKWQLGPAHPDYSDGREPRTQTRYRKQKTALSSKMRTCAYEPCGRLFVPYQNATHHSQSCAARHRWQRYYQNANGHDLRSCGCLSCSDERSARGMAPLIGAPT